MSTLASVINNESGSFQRNRAAALVQREMLLQRRAAARVGGSERARKRHRDRGRLLPRERIDALLDPGSPFLELGELAGEGLYDGIPPGGGIVTGVGVVHGKRCMIIANDPTVKGGTYFPITCKKHVRAQNFAWQHRLPCITLVDSGGAYLPEQAGIFPDDGQFGSIFYNQVRMSGEGIPQIAVVMGPSTAGGAYIPALCDEIVIVREQGAMFLGGPQLVKAATGEVVDTETLGGAEMHSRVSGVTDHIAADDLDALAIVREIVRDLHPQPAVRWGLEAVKAPLYLVEELYGVISHDPKTPTDNREIIARLVDGSRFQEFKALYGDTLLCGFAHIMGYPVGIIANNGVFFSESATKGAHFIDLCCKRDIPLLFMADVTGFMVGQEAESLGIAKAGAKLITAMCSANVPKYTLITGGAYGAGYLAMCGRPFRPNALLMWPGARAAIMGPEQAANTLATVRRDALAAEGKEWSEEEEQAYKQPILDSFEAFANAYNFASNLWTDAVIDPVETREVLALLLDLSGRLPALETQFGVFRQ